MCVSHPHRALDIAIHVSRQLLLLSTVKQNPGIIAEQGKNAAMCLYGRMRSRVEGLIMLDCVGEHGAGSLQSLASDSPTRRRDLNEQVSPDELVSHHHRFGVVESNDFAQRPYFDQSKIRTVGSCNLISVHAFVRAKQNIHC